MTVVKTPWAPYECLWWVCVLRFSISLRLGLEASWWVYILSQDLWMLSQNGLELYLNIEETSDLGCSNVSHGLCGWFSESRRSQKWFSPYILFSQEHWREDQKAWMSGTPSPPRSVGVKMRDLGYLCLFPAMKEVIRLSSWRINDL